MISDAYVLGIIVFNDPLCLGRAGREAGRNDSGRSESAILRIRFRPRDRHGRLTHSPSAYRGWSREPSCRWSRNWKPRRSA